MSLAEPDVAAGLRDLAKSEHPYPAERFDGRGIVICAGGARLFSCAWVCISILRRTLKNPLPIEVWHLGEQELGAPEAAMLAELGATAVDATAIRDPARVLGGWELKPYALANCRFREVLLLDADNVPITDPAYLFDSQPFRDTGALFWPDAKWLASDNEIWELCGLPSQTARAWESGQLLLDKARCWAPLQLVRYMNDHSELFYRYLHGDKDTFNLAWQMLGAAYAMPRRGPRVMEWGLLQHDFDGQPLFQHRNLTKWALRGTNSVDATFVHRDACLAALGELGARWSGRIEQSPARTPGDLELEAELAHQRLFVLEREGSDSFALELLSSNRIGDGRGDDHQRWHVLEGTLVLSGLRGPTAELEAGPDGIWRGRSLQTGAHPLELRPVADASSEPARAVIAALLERVDAGELAVEDAVAAFVTIGAVADVRQLLICERVRWPEGSGAINAIDQARWRLGRRDPSLRAHEGGDARRYGPT
jgi:hypothetical protein